MLNVQEILEELQRCKDIEYILEKYDWKSFESFTEFVFQANGFTTKRNFRFKFRKRHEVDIVAEREVLFFVECKRWGRGRHKKSSLVKSSNKLLQAILEFKDYSQIDKKIIPIIVTLWDEGFYYTDEVFFIPIWNLNSFLLSEIWR